MSFFFKYISFSSIESNAFSVYEISDAGEIAQFIGRCPECTQPNSATRMSMLIAETRLLVIARASGTNERDDD